jgi:hypothetical protein
MRVPDAASGDAAYKAALLRLAEAMVALDCAETSGWPSMAAAEAEYARALNHAEALWAHRSGSTEYSARRK